MKNPSKELQRDIDAFLRRTGMPSSAFGWAVAMDPSFVTNLRNGREVRFKTLTRARRYLDMISKELATRAAD
jgi:hypothetical protein